MNANEPVSAQKDAKNVVLSAINALNNEDFDAAKNYFSDDMSFVGVLGSRDGADAYFADMKHMKLKYDIKKAIADDNDVCLFYDLKMSGITIFGCGWYSLNSEGKINSLKVIFDPRPVLEQGNKK